MADPDLAEADEGPSRSQRKREHQALQDLVQQLALDVSLLPQIECDEPLRDGIELLSRMKPSSARNRQIRHLAKYLSKDEGARLSIENALQQKQLEAQATNQKLHRAEYWRDLLIEDDSQLADCVDELPSLDVQRTRQLLREIGKNGPEQKQTRLRRELFRLLREAL